MILLGILHCLRGRGWLPRWALFLLVFLLAFAETMNPVLAAVTIAGIVLWLVRGWGRGFACITGDRESLRQPEVKWIDTATDFLLNTGQSHYDSLTPSQVRAYGTMWMSLRGLHLYPLFLAYFLWNPWAPLVGLLCLLQGPLYYLAGRLTLPHAVALAELLVGTLFGLMITLTV